MDEKDIQPPLLRKIVRKERMEGGELQLTFNSQSCFHCVTTRCATVCPTGSILRDTETGIVIHDNAPCIGCGRCAQVCHAGLLPYEIVRRLENMHYERLPGLHPEECDGCGACSCVCPAGREVSAKVMEATQSHGTIFLNWGDDDDA